MDNIKSIIIDPRFIFNYGSYYIYGLMHHFKHAKIRFACIPDISIYNYEDYRKGLPFLVERLDGSNNKIFIDTNDRNNVHKKYYDWCDTYAKINVNSVDLATNKKLLPIGPSFSIRIWNPLLTLSHSISNYSKCNYSDYKMPIKRYVLDYLYTIVRRLPYNSYHTNCHEKEDYIFTLNTLWYDEGTYNSTNYLRGVFARQCKENFTNFEGGFFYIDSKNVINEFPKYTEYLHQYSDMLITRRISMRSYNKHIKDSYLVFNTPSVCGCHGWKLGEFLAMGKAIISTPLNNVMPGEFKSGTHYFEVKTEDEITHAIQYLKDNPDMVNQLKINAKKYFEEYLSPEKVIERILLFTTQRQ